MINPKDIDFTNPDSIKNLPPEFLKEMADGRDENEKLAAITKSALDLASIAINEAKKKGVGN